MSTADLLVVAPYIGEFGWELMNWQGRVIREIERSSGRKIFLCAPPDRRSLYREPIDGNRVRFCPMPRIDWPGAANDDHRIDEAGLPLDPAMLRETVIQQTSRVLQQLGIDSIAAEWLTPSYRSTIWPTAPDSQHFRSLRTTSLTCIDVVLIPRFRDLAAERNRSEAWWDELAERLRAGGLTVEMYEPRTDLAIEQLCRTRLAAGASTGGLHLASLCGCPHFVWGAGAEARWTSLGITNRQRYETVWNPLGTPCRYDEIGWQPSIEKVEKGILESLDSIGLQANGRRIAVGFGMKWRVKRGMARALEAPSGRSMVPWRVREIVRKYLV